MKSRFKKLLSFCADDEAAEVSELAIILGLIVAGVVAVVVILGPIVKQMFETTNDAMPSS